METFTDAQIADLLSKPAELYPIAYELASEVMALREENRRLTAELLNITSVGPITAISRTLSS